MRLLPAETEFELSHGGNTVRLRASLRAALHLERLHDGFGPLFQRIDTFDTTTIRQVILIAATDRNAAEAFLRHMATQPLRTLAEATHGPLASLCAALMPSPTTSTKPRTTSAKTMPWADYYSELFRIATGWLGWTPDTAWNATPAEITCAFEGHVAKLTAIHGNAEHQDDSTTENQQQRERNIAAGLDPDFDREGLHALKALMQ
ncbi:phage tail assembly chaperone [Cereibacter changlensis]|uniref:phage tail assembly chaperone n=1 Tax=Cereibacter changlensis TaxID=402884 RepID=UPI0040343FAA